jgi:APA family basic amino acid/polyamine antiporter
LFRTWGYPIVPIVFIAATVIIVANQIVAEPARSATGLLLVLAGLPVYMLWARRGIAEGAAADGSH